MTQSLVEKRDKLIDQLHDTPGFVSVGFAKKDDDIVLLVAIEDSFRGDVPETFQGIRVIVQDLGEARVVYNGRT